MIQYLIGFGIGFVITSIIGVAVLVHTIKRMWP